MWEWPKPQLLFTDHPQPRQTVRLDDQKENDQGAEDHRLQITHKVDRYRKTGEAWRVVEKDWQEHDEGSAEERAQDAAETADDNHKQNLERPVDLERAGLDGARIDKGPHRAGDAAVKRAQGKGEQFGAQRADADDLGGNVHVTDRHPGAPNAAAD